MTTTPPHQNDPALPVAEVRPAPSHAWLWWLPLAALALGGWLLYQELGTQGEAVTISFARGYGLKPGDVLRYRGIDVGTVQAVQLATDLEGIVVTANLNPAAQTLAQEGSRFWIERPQLDLSGLRGLKTVIGANYLGVLPGSGPPQQVFEGLEAPPQGPELYTGGLMIRLTSSGRAGLREGAPVSYRDVAIGTITSVDLARDASRVEAMVYIRPPFTALIRDNTRFWKVGGATLSAGLSGLQLDVESLQSLLLGGIALAVPPEPGQPATTDQRFALAPEPDPDWLAWAPSIPLDEAAAVQARPPLLPAQLSWEGRNFLYLLTEQERRGWLLPLRDGLLGPANLLRPPEEAEGDDIHLRVADQTLPLTNGDRLGEYLAILPVNPAPEIPWPRQQLRVPSDPEDLMLSADPQRPPRFVAVDRLEVHDHQWRIDPTLTLPPSWHGAAALALSDNALIGILLVTEDGAFIAPNPLPPPPEGGINP